MKANVLLNVILKEEKHGKVVVCVIIIIRHKTKYLLPMR